MTRKSTTFSKNISFDSQSGSGYFPSGSNSTDNKKSKLVDQVRSLLRAKHYKLSTEQSYISWIKNSILFHKKRHPLVMGEPEVNNGTVKWTEMGWPSIDPPLKDAKGIYVLYKDDNSIYVGIAIKGDDPIAKRLHDHTKDWLAPWWGSVCWYDFSENLRQAEIVESLMISHAVGLWNGSETGGKHFGKQFF